MTVEINVLSDALGAEVVGLDLSSPVAQSHVAAIQGAFLEHHLLCIRGKALEADAFARVARYFGEPQLQLLRDQRVEGTPEVSILESTYKSSQDKPGDLAMVRLSGWHTDDSYFAAPCKATMLQGLMLPSGRRNAFLQYAQSL